MPIVNHMMWHPESMAACIPHLKAGNLHLDTDTKAQGEYLVCGADAFGDHPRLLATWVLNMDAASRGTIALAGDGVVGRYEYFGGQPSRAQQTVTDLINALKARFGDDLEVPPYDLDGPDGIVASHHLGGAPLLPPHERARRGWPLALGITH